MAGGSGTPGAQAGGQGAQGQQRGSTGEGEKLQRGGAPAEGTRAERGGGLSRWQPWPALFGEEHPFALMRRLWGDMDRLLSDELLGGGAIGPGRRIERGLRQGLWVPRIDVTERDGRFVVRADLPGLSKDDVRVEITDDALILEGERRSEYDENREGLRYSERTAGSFRRVIPLPEGVDSEDANARFENGVLEIDLKSTRKPKTRRLEIQGGGANQGSQTRH